VRVRRELRGRRAREGAVSFCVAVGDSVGHVVLVRSLVDGSKVLDMM
jgi:hypothetical protein